MCNGTVAINFVVQLADLLAVLKHCARNSPSANATGMIIFIQGSVEFRSIKQNALKPVFTGPPQLDLKGLVRSILVAFNIDSKIKLAP